MVLDVCGSYEIFLLIKHFATASSEIATLLLRNHVQI